MAAALRCRRGTLTPHPPNADTERGQENTSTPRADKRVRAQLNTELKPRRHYTADANKSTAPKHNKPKSETKHAITPSTTNGTTSQASTTWDQAKRNREERWPSPPTTANLTANERECAPASNAVFNFNLKLASWYTIWVLLSTNTLCVFTHHYATPTKSTLCILQCPSSISTSSPPNHHSALYKLPTFTTTLNWPTVPLSTNNLCALTHQYDITTTSILYTLHCSSSISINSIYTTPYFTICIHCYTPPRPPQASPESSPAPAPPTQHKNTTVSIRNYSYQHLSTHTDTTQPLYYTLFLSLPLHKRSRPLLPPIAHYSLPPSQHLPRFDHQLLTYQQPPHTDTHRAGSLIHPLQGLRCLF